MLIPKVTLRRPDTIGLIRANLQIHDDTQKPTLVLHENVSVRYDPEEDDFKTVAKEKLRVEMQKLIDQYKASMIIEKDVNFKDLKVAVENSLNLT